MDENRERLKGKTDEVIGNLKEGVGDLIGNERLEAEGRAQELDGEARQEAAKTVGQAKGALQEAEGNIKQGWGDLTGDERLEAEGKVDELEGEARRRANQ